MGIFDTGKEGRGEIANMETSLFKAKTHNYGFSLVLPNGVEMSVKWEGERISHYVELYVWKGEHIILQPTYVAMPEFLELVNKYTQRED